MIKQAQFGIVNATNRQGKPRRTSADNVTEWNGLTVTINSGFIKCDQSMMMVALLRFSRCLQIP